MIKKFLIFKESLYSAAAMLAKNFTKPVTNIEYNVIMVKIKFPDSTEAIFKIKGEDVYSDKINYTIEMEEFNTKNSIYKLRACYLRSFGPNIQLENYNEFVLVRCWTNPIDFLENQWNGHMFNKGTGLIDIEMKFYIQELLKNHMSRNDMIDHYNSFRNPLIDIKYLSIMLDRYEKDISKKSHQDVSRLILKLENSLWDIEKLDSISIEDEKINEVHIIAIVYAMMIRDNDMLKRWKTIENYIDESFNIKTYKFLNLFHS